MVLLAITKDEYELSLKKSKHGNYLERSTREICEEFHSNCSRLTWLKKGSRDVFGTVLENNIYVLIDTSKSMQHHLGFVKEKLRLLIKVCSL